MKEVVMTRLMQQLINDKHGALFAVALQDRTRIVQLLSTSMTLLIFPALGHIYVSINSQA